MAGVTFWGCRFVLPKDRAMARWERSGLNYVATREGVQVLRKEQALPMQRPMTDEQMLRYMGTRPGVEMIDGEHGLFGAWGKADLQAEIDRLAANPKSTEYRCVLSLTKEEAQTAGLNSPVKWQELLISRMPEVAGAAGISPENLVWNAAFHPIDKHGQDHHPHVHICFYSLNPAQGNLEGVQAVPRATLARQRSIWHHAIHAQEVQVIDQRTTMAREAGKRMLAKLLEKAPNPQELAMLAKLADALPKTGRPYYGYLPAPVKKQVDDLLRYMVTRPGMEEAFAAAKAAKADQLKAYQTDPDKIDARLADWEQHYFHPTGKEDRTELHNALVLAARQLRQMGGKEQAVLERKVIKRYLDTVLTDREELLPVKHSVGLKIMAGKDNTWAKELAKAHAADWLQLTDKQRAQIPDLIGNLAWRENLGEAMSNLSISQVRQRMNTGFSRVPMGTKAKDLPRHLRAAIGEQLPPGADMFTEGILTDHLLEGVYTERLQEQIKEQPEVLAEIVVLLERVPDELPYQTKDLPKQLQSPFGEATARLATALGVQAERWQQSAPEAFSAAALRMEHSRRYLEQREALDELLKKHLTSSALAPLTAMVDLRMDGWKDNKGIVRRAEGLLAQLSVKHRDMAGLTDKQQEMAKALLVRRAWKLALTPAMRQVLRSTEQATKTMHGMMQPGDRLEDLSQPAVMQLSAYLPKRADEISRKLLAGVLLESVSEQLLQQEIMQDPARRQALREAMAPFVGPEVTLPRKPEELTPEQKEQLHHAVRQFAKADPQSAAWQKHEPDRYERAIWQTHRQCQYEEQHYRQAQRSMLKDTLLIGMALADTAARSAMQPPQKEYRKPGKRKPQANEQQREQTGDAPEL